MSRSERLLALLQALRRYRRPVSGQTLAGELGVSLRTLYRDIATLQAQGAGIEGEAGLGYVLRPGFMLPPLMFSEEEIEALVLGSRWVAMRADDRLGRAARDAVAKIAAVLPADLRDQVDASSLLVASSAENIPEKIDPAAIRVAIRTERKIEMRYRTPDGTETERTIWPIALAFIDSVRMVVAWCEMRQGFRHFRTDRIISQTVSEERYPRRRQILLKEWRAAERIPPAI